MEDGDLVFSVVPKDDKQTMTEVTAIRHLTYVRQAKFARAEPDDVIEEKLRVENDQRRSQLWVGKRKGLVVVSARLMVCEDQEDFAEEMGIPPEMAEQLWWSNKFPVLSLGRAVNISGTPTAYLALRYYVLRYLWARYLAGDKVEAQVAKTFQGQKFLRALPKYGYEIRRWAGPGMYCSAQEGDTGYFTSCLWLEAFPYAIACIEDEARRGLAPALGKPLLAERQSPFSLGRWVGPWPYPLIGDGPLSPRDWEADFDGIYKDEEHSLVMQERRPFGPTLDQLRPPTNRPPKP